MANYLEVEFNLLGVEDVVVIIRGTTGTGGVSSSSPIDATTNFLRLFFVENSSTTDYDDFSAACRPFIFESC